MSHPASSSYGNKHPRASSVPPRETTSSNDYFGIGYDSSPKLARTLSQDLRRPKTPSGISSRRTSEVASPNVLPASPAPSHPTPQLVTTQVAASGLHRRGKFWNKVQLLQSQASPAGQEPAYRTYGGRKLRDLQGHGELNIIIERLHGHRKPVVRLINSHRRGGSMQGRISFATSSYLSMTGAVYEALQFEVTDFKQGGKRVLSNGQWRLLKEVAQGHWFTFDSQVSCVRTAISSGAGAAKTPDAAGPVSPAVAKPFKPRHQPHRPEGAPDALAAQRALLSMTEQLQFVRLSSTGGSIGNPLRNHPAPQSTAHTYIIGNGHAGFEGTSPMIILLVAGYDAQYHLECREIPGPPLPMNLTDEVRQGLANVLPQVIEADQRQPNAVRCGQSKVWRTVQAGEWKVVVSQGPRPIFAVSCIRIEMRT